MSQTGFAGIPNRASFQDFVVQKSVDRTSPELALACAEGRHFSTMVVDITRSGAEAGPFMVYRFNDCLVTGLQPASSGDTVIENLSFSYAEIERKYASQHADGSLGDTVARSFSLLKGQGVTEPFSATQDKSGGSKRVRRCRCSRTSAIRPSS